MSGVDSGSAVGVTILETIADAEGVEPTELEPPLGTVVDTDALDALFSNADGTVGRVAFQYAGYEVVVDSDGRVDVEELSSSKITLDP